MSDQCAVINGNVWTLHTGSAYHSLTPWKLWNPKKENFEQILEVGYTDFEINPKIIELNIPPIVEISRELFARGEEYLAPFMIPQMSQAQFQVVPDYGFRMERGRAIVNPTPIQIKEGRVYENANLDWFHYHPDLKWWLIGQGVIITPELERLFYHCSELYNAANYLSLLIAEELDKLRPDHEFAARVKAALRLNTLRCLFYNENRKGVAKSLWHTDRSLWGFHWKSLFHALVLLIGAEMVDGKPVGGTEVHPDETTSDRVLVFFGQHAEAICTCGKCKAVLHRPDERRKDLNPIPPESTGERRFEDLLRDAIVSFIKAFLGDIPPKLFKPPYPGR